MQDENNLFFTHEGRKYRVETNNIVLQYSRGYPSMTALNAAFNDSDEETQTISKRTGLFMVMSWKIIYLNFQYSIIFCG